MAVNLDHVKTQVMAHHATPLHQIQKEQITAALTDLQGRSTKEVPRNRTPEGNPHSQKDRPDLKILAQDRQEPRDRHIQDHQVQNRQEPASQQDLKGRRDTTDLHIPKGAHARKGEHVLREMEAEDSKEGAVLHASAASQMKASTV